MRALSILFVVVLAMTAQRTLARIKGGNVPSPPTSEYRIREVEGWRVYVQKPLLDEQKELGDRALRLLESHLYHVVRAVPSRAVVELRKIPIWLHYKGRGNWAQYHPSREWLKDNGFNVDMTRCVDLGDAENFLRGARHQPMMVLHELAHGYHDQVLGWEQPDVKKAYQAALDSGLYDNVLIHNGRRGRAYAMTNHKEYFAETSEAFFGTNDIYPFVRAELREHDPTMYAVLTKLWAGPPEAHTADAKPRPGDAG